MMIYLLNNKKHDIFKEFYELQHGSINIQSFLNKYAFDILLLSKSDELYNEIYNMEGYFTIYDDTKKGYRVLVKNELFSDEKREEIIDSYNAALSKKTNNN